MADELEEMQQAVRRAARAAEENSNDDEIDALWTALHLALGRWPEIDKTNERPLS